MKNTTVVIPVHKLDTKEERDLLFNAIASAQQARVIIVAPADLESAFKAWKLTKNQTFLFHTNGGDLASQLNEVIASTTSEYITFLESDDTLRPNFFKTLDADMAAYPGTGIYLAMQLEVDEKGTVIRLMNEGAWSKSLQVDVLGELTEDALKEYHSFSLAGATIKVEEALQVGGFKAEMGWAFTYEFLLRFLHNGFSVRCLPKIGYNHLALRPGSWLEGLAATAESYAEVEKGLERAKQEYYVLPQITAVR